jgi:two-component system sensor histidine kinase KdpD
MTPKRVVLQPTARNRRAFGHLLAIVGTIGVTAVFVPFRGSLTPVSEAFAFLALVVAAAWVGGLGAGIVASILGFAAFNFFFIPPYNTFVIDRPEHIVVLFVLLGISIVISTLLATARDRAEAAEARKRELQALQDLSSELVGMVPGKDAYQRALSRLMASLGFTEGSLMLTDGDVAGALKEEVCLGAEPGTMTIQTNAARDRRSPERIPLTVGRNRLGILLLQGDRPPLTPGESRVLRAFSDQLALVLERDRLLRVAAKAETYRSTEKLRRALLTAVSHDLRSPLSAIKASVTDLLDRDTPLNASYQHEALESIDQEVDRLNALIANLLDMSRIETGMLRAHIQTFDVEESITPCVDRARRRWPDATFRSAVDPSTRAPRADPVFFERIVTNLLDNAARASLEAGEEQIDVDVRPGEGGVAVVRISDRGKGVPGSAREYLFQPLFGLDERSAHLGPGLGLAICKGFLDAMDGRIWIEETPGGGATFAFSLPAEVTR